MPSQPQNSANNEKLVKTDKPKEQAASSDVSGADTMTVEEREDEREAISNARPGGLERVLNEQRLPAEGIGAADGELRETFGDADSGSPIKDVPSGEYTGDPDRIEEDWEQAGRRADVQRDHRTC
ncbi:MAG: hypothetical protein ACRD1H_19530 [Vicinamibacterales bacterium]